MSAKSKLQIFDCYFLLPRRPFPVLSNNQKDMELLAFALIICVANAAPTKLQSKFTPGIFSLFVLYVSLLTYGSILCQNLIVAIKVATRIRHLDSMRAVQRHPLFNHWVFLPLAHPQMIFLGIR